MAGIYVFFMVECAMKARLVRRKQGQGNLHLCDDVISPEEMVRYFLHWNLLCSVMRVVGRGSAAFGKFW